MIREIIKDTEFLQIKCKSIGKDTPPENVTQLIQDLRDTAIFHEEEDNCVGLAANQIASNLRVIAVKMNDSWEIMINSTIVKRGNLTHFSEEGCLSLEGIRCVKRYCNVTVLYKNEAGKQRKLQCSGLIADIVQHEIDHLNGKMI